MKKILLTIGLLFCFCADPVSRPVQPVAPILVTFTVCYGAAKYAPYNGKIYTSKTDGSPIDLLMLLYPNTCDTLRVEEGQGLCVRFYVQQYKKEITTDYFIAHDGGSYNL
jgi:hypothetical protein